MPKQYRNGPLGALMDEYERAAEELKALVNGLSQHDFERILDAETADPDCRSAQTIMNHVVRATYGYANYIRIQYGDAHEPRKEDYDLTTPAKACAELDGGLAYTLQTLENKWNLSFEEVMNNIIKTRWGQHYDMEQLLEHAIVHILRHRRQIERLLGR